MPPTGRKAAVGIDVGGTTFTVCLIDQEGELLGDISYDTPADNPIADVLAAFASGVNELLTNFPEANDLDVVGIGMGVPGSVTPDEAAVRYCPNLGVLNDVPVPRLMADLLGLPAYVQNDAYCATLAELRYGGGRHYDNVLLVTLGTGVGGGIAFNNQVNRGPRQIMGEIGHMIIDPNGPVCNCGTVGCLEAYVGRQYLVDRAMGRIPVYPDGEFAVAARRDPACVSPKLIADCAKAGDELCGEIIAEMGFYVGIGLCNAIVMCDPDVILIGGGVAQAGEILFAPIRRTVGQRSPISEFDPANIHPAQLGFRAGAIGAAALVWEHAGS